MTVSGPVTLANAAALLDEGRRHLAEGVRSVETSFEQRWGAQRLFVGAFHSWWQDLVRLEDLDDEDLAAAIASGELLPDTPGAAQLRNVSAIRSYGFNLGYDGSLAGALRYGMSVTHAVTRVSEPGGSSDILPVAAPTIEGGFRVIAAKDSVVRARVRSSASRRAAT